MKIVYVNMYDTTMCSAFLTNTYSLHSAFSINVQSIYCSRNCNGSEYLLMRFCPFRQNFTHKSGQRKAIIRYYLYELVNSNHIPSVCVSACEFLFFLSNYLCSEKLVNICQPYSILIEFFFLCTAYILRQGAMSNLIF